MEAAGIEPASGAAIRVQTHMRVERERWHHTEKLIGGWYG